MFDTFRQSSLVTRELKFMAGVSLAAMLIASSPALAQTVSAETNNEAAADRSGAVNDIVVTAQKRSERLQDVPISISAVSGVALQQKSVTQVAQLSQSVPALRIDYAGNSIQPTIRGVGSQVAGPGFYSNIPIYVDGFYIPSPGSSDLNLVNVASVNVLKGPQGTLFGYNATGGAIQVTTRDPQHEMTGLARVSYARFNKVDAAGYITTGLSDTLAADLAVSYSRGDGYLTNLADRNNKVGRNRQWSVRTKLLWEPSDSVSFKLAYAHTYTDDPTANLTNPRDGGTFGIKVPGNIITSDPREIAANAGSFIRLNTDSITLTSAFDMGFATLTSYTGYRTDDVAQRLDYDATPANLVANQWTRPDKTFTQEFNLTSKSGGRFNWVLGAFYMYHSNIYDFAGNSAVSPDGTGAPFNHIFTSKNSNNSYAVFADATYEVVDNLFLTAGARYSIDKPRLSFDLFNGLLTGSGGTKFTDLSPRAVVRYQMTPRSNVYASYTQGYKAGTLPGSSFSLVPVRPEKIDAFEVGYKSAGSIVRLNVAAFYYNYKDIQVSIYGPGGRGVFLNAASAKIYGIDGDVNFAVTPDFDITLSGVYMHARYKDFPNAIGYVQDLAPLSATYGKFVTLNINANDFPVARTPDFSGSIGASYRVNVGGGKLALNGNLFYTSKFYFDSVKQLPQKAYALLNLKATWTDPSDQFDVSVFGTNVTGTKYRIQNFIDDTANRQVWGEPAVYGVQVGVRF